MLKYYYKCDIGRLLYLSCLKGIYGQEAWQRRTEGFRQAWGSGIPKMFQEAKEYGLRESELIDMGSDFCINFYRKKAITDQKGVIDPRERDTNDTKVDTNDTYEKAVLNTIQNDLSV